MDPTAGTVLRLYPSDCTGSIRVDYLPDPVAFANDAAVWSGPGRSDQLICLWVAARGCRKEGRRADAADLMQDYAELLAKVASTASWLDQKNPPMIRDVDSEFSGRFRDPFDYPVD